jgi:hypothetical protein
LNVEFALSTKLGLFEFFSTMHDVSCVHTGALGVGVSYESFLVLLCVLVCVRVCAACLASVATPFRFGSAAVQWLRPFSCLHAQCTHHRTHTEQAGQLFDHACAAALLPLRGSIRQHRRPIRRAVQLQPSQPQQRERERERERGGCIPRHARWQRTNDMSSRFEMKEGDQRQSSHTARCARPRPSPACQHRPRATRPFCTALPHAVSAVRASSLHVQKWRNAVGETPHWMEPAACAHSPRSLESAPSCV